MHRLLSFILLESKISSIPCAPSKRFGTLKVGGAKLRLFTRRKVETWNSFSGKVFEIFGMR